MARTFSGKKLWLSLAVLIIVVIAVLLITNPRHWFRAAKSPVVTGSQATKGEPVQSSSASQTNSSTGNDTNQPGDTKSSTSGSPNVNLLTPSGPFVSNHRPSLSANLTEASACNTTPGASCQITFTNHGTVKSLNVQTTDRGGAAYWSWKPQDIGLTTGSWHITATATLDTQKTTADDALTLDVSP